MQMAGKDGLGKNLIILMISVGKLSLSHKHMKAVNDVNA